MGIKDRSQVIQVEQEPAKNKAHEQMPREVKNFKEKLKHVKIREGHWFFNILFVSDQT